jgi:Pyridoxamine 5'-phosphate oxidase
MSPGYLAYVEQSADGEMSSITRLRLSKVLGISSRFLAGGDVARPPGIGRAGPDPTLDSLTPQQCETHLQGGGIGRIVFVSGRGPTSFPVNFAYGERHVVFRTDAGTALALTSSGNVGFEIDQIDEAMGEGWSVLLTGPAHEVTDPNHIAQLERLRIEPWAGGDRPIFVQIAAQELSGRAIRQGSQPASEMSEGSFGPTRFASSVAR